MAFSKASKAEFARDYDQAFRHYLQAADYFLHLFRSSTAPEKSRQQWKSSADKSLERAEKIKRFVDVSRSNNQPGSVPASSAQQPAEVRLTPVGIDYFSPRRSFAISPIQVADYCRGAIPCSQEGWLCQWLVLPIVGWCTAIQNNIWRIFVSIKLSCKASSYFIFSQRSRRTT